MRNAATTTLVLLGLLAATSAFALDLPRKGQVPAGQHRTFTIESVNAVLSCDNQTPESAYFQDDNWRFGNLFDFGAGALISTVQFAHFGFGFDGPYQYDIELWDPTSCTLIGSVDNLVAADAALEAQVETVPLCASNLYADGPMVVAIDANTCLDPTDCYPDLLFDGQINVFCPVIVDATSPAAADCYDQSNLSGPFLLRVETNNCPVPSKVDSWGKVKVLYR